MNSQIVKDFGLGLIFIFSQVLFFQHLTIFGTSVDPVIFYLLFLISKYNRISLLLIAAAFGLIQDAFFDFWGIFMFSKTLFVFLTFSFIKKRSENQLLVWQIFFVIFIGSLIHNIIFTWLSSFFDTYVSNYSMLIMIFGNAIYTSFVGSLIFVFKAK